MMSEYNEDLYHLLIDDVREAISVSVEKVEYRRMAFIKLNHLEEINRKLIEKLETVLEYSEEGLLIDGDLADEIVELINKAKG